MQLDGSKKALVTAKDDVYTHTTLTIQALEQKRVLRCWSYTMFSTE